MHQKIFYNNKNLQKKFREFYKIYKKRPINKNDNGVKIEHSFFLFLVIKKLKPEYIIESGVFAGQSTWLIEKFCPEAKIYCFDTNLSNLYYKSKKAEYHENDLSKYDWSIIKNKNKALIFFDDHVSFYERLIFSKKNNFKHLVFDDNYPPLIGDCYSFKKILAGVDNEYLNYEYFQNPIFGKLKFYIKKIIGFKKFYGSREVTLLHDKIRIFDKKRYVKFKPEHKFFFLKNVKIYYEFPPIINLDVKKRWKKYKHLDQEFLKSIDVQKGIFDKADIRKLISRKDYLELSSQYNYFCYLKVKS